MQNLIGNITLSSVIIPAAFAFFVGLALSGQRMYAESHLKYITFKRYYKCSCSKLRYQTHQ